MALTPEITAGDLRRLIETLQIAIEGMAALGERVKALEDANQQSYATAVALKENQELLFAAQKSQQEVNALLKRSLDELLSAIGNNRVVQ